MHEVVPIEKVAAWLVRWLETAVDGRSPSDLEGARARALLELRALAEPRVTDAMIDAAVASVWRASWCMPEVAKVLRADLSRALDTRS